VKIVEQSIHYAAEKNGKGAHCVDCHGKHDIRSSKDTASRTFALNLPATCAQCHSQQRLPGAAGMIADSYLDSVHGRGVARSGLVVSANCTSCHGAHDIKAKTDPASHVHRDKIVGTCATCHEGIQATFLTSVHAQPAKNGAKTPVCSDCHTSHQIQRTGTDQWRLAAIQECGSCHLDKISTYRDTFHGQETALGFTRVATCSDCHGTHNIHAANNPASLIAPQNLVTTCRKCHAQANANFVKYDPHADKHDAKRSPQLYWSYKFMQLLLAGVFLAFGAHTLVWFPRSYRARREHDENGGGHS
jgi:5-methylcytosine-specific restriction endonuclease McrA